MELKSSPADKNYPDFVKYESICPILPVNSFEMFEDREVEVFEKIDGGNCQVRRIPANEDGYTIIGGSRANFLKGVVLQRREWFQEFNKWMFQNGSLYNLPENTVLFGEFSGNHTITYSPESDNKFFLIDLFDINSGRFFPYEESRRMIGQNSIENVIMLDILFKGRISDKDVKRLLNKQSQYYRGPKEGIVIKDYSSTPQTFAKVLHPNFAEKRIRKNGVKDYLTPSRYRKAILRWLDENQGNQRLDESLLVEIVRQEILREEMVNTDPIRIKRRLKLYLTRGKLPEIAGLI